MLTSDLCWISYEITVVNWNQNTAVRLTKTTERGKNEVQRQFSELYLAKQCWACFHFNKHELSRQSNKLPSETTDACYFCSVKSLTRSSNNKSPKSKVCVMSHLYMQPFINNEKLFGIQTVYQKVENLHNTILHEQHPIIYPNWNLKGAPKRNKKWDVSPQMYVIILHSI